MIATDLSKQQVLDTDPKSVQQINFTRNLKSFTKYLRQTLVFMRNSEARKSFNFYFSAVFC